MNLKKNLKYLMKKNTLSIVEISSKTSIPKQTLHNWLSGASPKNVNQLRKIATYFRTTVDELCFGDVSQPSTKDESPWIKYEEEITAGVFEVILRPVKVKKVSL